MIRRILTVLAALGIALTTVHLASGPASAAAAPPATATAATMAQGPCPASGTHPQIREFDRSNWVRHARCLLRETYGYPVPDSEVFTSTFKAHIMHFQTQKSLAPDGIIGEMTWYALHNP